MNTQAKVQQVSDEFHRLTGNIDTLLADLSRLTALAAEARIETGMNGVESQRTLKHLANICPALIDARSSLTLAHAAAQNSAPKADFPWECPDEASAQAAPPALQVVNG